MIFEGVITTCAPDGGAHIAPLGFQRIADRIVLRPFTPSNTLDNLRRHHSAAMNITDDVRITAGCLTRRRDWPVVPTTKIRGWRLKNCLAHLELEVESAVEDAQRPSFNCRIVEESKLRSSAGFNRAQAAVIEAAILVSRLDFIDTDKLEAEMKYLHIAITKTAGSRERTAWGWLVEAIAAHPRHSFAVSELA